jgi:hypothetical protein
MEKPEIAAVPRRMWPQRTVEGSRVVRNTVFGLPSFVAVCVAVLLSVAPALADQPAPGGHYFGFPARAGTHPVLADGTVFLRVSRDGRRLAAAKLQLRACRRGGELVDAEELRLSFRGNPDARIQRDGSFKVAHRHGRIRFRLAGRFITSQEARLFYRASERRRLTVCRSGEGESPAALYRDGQPPFSGCRTQRARTLASTDAARIFEQVKAHSPSARSPFVSFFPHVYACLFDSPSKRFDLGQNWDDSQLGAFRLAGPYVAFFQGGCGACIWAQDSIDVHDLRDGSLVRRPDLEWGTRPMDLALKANGSLAWTLERFRSLEDGSPTGPIPGDGPPVVVAREVWVLDSQGQRLLDSGLDLDIQSLGLNDSILTWINGGTQRSATLD